MAGQADPSITEEAPPPELKAMLDLIQALVTVNKRVVTLTSIITIQKRLMTKYPSLILKFKVDRDFKLRCRMKGDEKDLEALGKFLEEYLKILMDIVSPKSLADRICSTVRDLGQEAALELLASGAADLLPVELIDQIRTAADFGDRLNTLRSKDASTQAVTVYETIYSRYLAETISTLRPPPAFLDNFCRRLRTMVKRNYPFIEEFRVEKGSNVSIMTTNVELEVLLEALAHIYDAIVFGASQIWDPDEARNLGRRTALTVLGDYEQIPDKCGVTSSLLKGALSSKVRTGILGFDRLLEGGLDRNSGTLLVSEDLIERDFLLASFIRRGFQDGEDILLIISRMDTDRLLDMLSEEAIHDEGLGRIKLDVFTPVKDSRSSEGEDGSVPPSNLIDLNKSILRHMKEHGPGPKRALLDILDGAKEAFGAGSIYWYLSRYLTILKENGFSAIFIVNPSVFGREDIEKMYDMFENTIEIRRRGSSFTYEIGRTAAKRPILDPEYKVISFSDRGLTISDE